jgi:DNA-binding transcriptional regulator YhcF (GntR family)
MAIGARVDGVDSPGAGLEPICEPLYEPMYEQVADAVREQIARGQYRAGQRLPAEGELVALHSVSLVTVRRALAALREEGLIATQRGVQAIVRPRPRRRGLVLDPGSRLVSRMPTNRERRELGMARGVPVLEIRRPDGRVETIDAELVEVIAHPQLRAQITRGRGTGAAPGGR